MNDGIYLWCTIHGEYSPEEAENDCPVCVEYEAWMSRQEAD